MAFRPEDVDRARAAQLTAAHDEGAAVRLVAGPGTGKSSTIEERVRWLLTEQGNAASAVFAVSFTRASAYELRERVKRYCSSQVPPIDEQISVTTLHSLALRILRRAGLLGAYPVGPSVMDRWELRNIYAAECSITIGKTPTRCEAIRREHEAFWSTGSWDPPNWIPPDPPITDVERGNFRTFHRPRSQLYSCVLPGEIVRECVRQREAGTLDLRETLGADHIIVDEYQDLNPADIQFVEQLIDDGVKAFVAGDDDQSIYSFRFATPSGIQDFTTNHPASGDYELADCFRCCPAVIDAAGSLIEAHPLPGRIPKDLTSLYGTANPPVEGLVHRWRFGSAGEEARAIAETCRDLIGEGVAASEILILLSDTRALGKDILGALDRAGVEYAPPREHAFKDTDGGRVVLSLLRVSCDPEDYVALRTVLGLKTGVGPGTCNQIARIAIERGMNYRDLYTVPIPADVFSTRQLGALTTARGTVDALSQWTSDDLLEDRADELRNLIDELGGDEALEAWDDLAELVPRSAKLSEVLEIVWSETEVSATELLIGVYERLGEEIPPEVTLPDRIRVMTMHGAKGLSAQIVFIPGLEQEIFPGARRSRYPGLVLEGARMLYVAITRARGVCVLSYAGRRTRFGQSERETPSAFAADLGGPFSRRDESMTESEREAVLAVCDEL